MHLLSLQQCAVVWGYRAIGKQQIEAQAAHLGDLPDGGFFVFGHNTLDFGVTSIARCIVWTAVDQIEPPLQLGYGPMRIAMEANLR